MLQEYNRKLEFVCHHNKDNEHNARSHHLLLIIIIKYQGGMRIPYSYLNSIALVKYYR